MPWPRPAKGLECLRLLRLHGAGLDAQQLGDLALTAVLVETQHQHGSLARWQGTQHIEHLRSLGEPVLGRLRLDPHGLARLFSLRNSSAPPSAGHVVDDCTVEVAADVVDPPRLPLLEHLGAHVGDHVVGDGWITGQQQREPEQARAMFGNRFGEGGLGRGERDRFLAAVEQLDVDGDSVRPSSQSHNRTHTILDAQPAGEVAQSSSSWIESGPEGITRFLRMTENDPIASGELLYSVTDGVARVTLNRPDAANAITPDQRNTVIRLMEEASGDLNVRVVVISANGKHFCTGADLRVSKVPDNPRPEGAPERALGDVGRNIKRGAQRLIASVLDCEKPVIAAVNGTAAGIGAHLALAADLTIASDAARFIEIFVRRGITPDGGGAYLLPRIVGVKKAKELIFYGDDLPATEAERIGLINKCVPADELAATVDDWASRLSTGPTKAIGLAKWLLNRSLESDRNTAFEEEAWAQELASRTEDFGEGVEAFIQRREVKFKGW